MPLWTGWRVAAISIFALALSADASWGSQGLIPVEDPLRLLLRAHVRNGEVDYAGVGRDHQIAFYINAYNACTIDLIVKQMRARGGRMTSIQQIPGAWNRHTWVVAGRNSPWTRSSTTSCESDSESRASTSLWSARRAPALHFHRICSKGPICEHSSPPPPTSSCSTKPATSSHPRMGRSGSPRSSTGTKTISWPRRRRTQTSSGYTGRSGALLSFLQPMLPCEVGRALREARVQIEFLPYDWSLNGPRNG